MEACMIVHDNSENFSPITHVNGLPMIFGFILIVVMVILAMPPMKNELTLQYSMHGGGFCCDEIGYAPVVNKIEILEGGEIMWNGKTSNLTEIQKYLREITKMNPQPELHFHPAPNANYEAVIKTVTMVQQSGVTFLGWAGNEQYRVFGKAKRK
jgi:biopolymer transport protein ExbD